MTPTTIARRVWRTVTAMTWVVALALTTAARRDPEFMTFDAAARRVDLTVIAAFDQSYSGYNFNGAAHGTHLLTVPLGWQVRVAFSNRDVFPHSAVVIRQPKTLPLRIARPVFAGAATRSFQQGLPPGDRDDFAFVASSTGDYLISCGSVGHIVLGSFLRMRVSQDVTVPTYEQVPRDPSLRHD